MMLFDDAVKAYLDDKSRRLRGNTLEGYVSALRCHVMPEFSGVELESITHEELQRWVDSIPTYGAAGKAYKTFRQVFRWSLRRWQLRVWDVTQGVELPERPVVATVAWSTLDRESYLSHADVWMVFDWALS